MSGVELRLRRRLSTMSDQAVAELPLKEWEQIQRVITSPEQWASIIPHLSNTNFTAINTAAFANVVAPVVAADLIRNLAKRDTRHMQIEVHGQDAMKRATQEVATLVVIHACEAYGKTFGTKLLTRLYPEDPSIRYTFLLGRLRSVVGSRVLNEFHQDAVLPASNWEYGAWASSRRRADAVYEPKNGPLHHLGIALGVHGEAVNLGHTEVPSWTLEELVESDSVLTSLLDRIVDEAWIDTHLHLVSGATGSPQKVERYRRIFALCLDSNLPPDPEVVGMSESGIRSARENACANLILAAFQTPELFGLDAPPEGDHAKQIMQLMPVSARGKRRFRDLPWDLVNDAGTGPASLS